MNVLKTWKLQWVANDRELVFATRNRKALPPNQIYSNYWIPLLVKLGLAGPRTVYAHPKPSAGGRAWYAKPNYHFHALRHVAASLFIEQGFTPKRVQDLLGHSSINMTFDIYGHLFPAPEDDAEAMAQLQARVMA